MPAPHRCLGCDGVVERAIAVGGVPKWTKGTDCKSVIRGFESHRRLIEFTPREVGITYGDVDSFAAALESPPALVERFSPFAPIGKSSPPFESVCVADTVDAINATER